MKMVIQRVRQASVTVEDQVIGAINHGLLVFLGVGESDHEKKADIFIKKLLNLRIFEDENGKTNLSCKDTGGSLLIVSQFTLYADCRKGNRPSFIHAGNPQQAEKLYNYVINRCRENGFTVECGEFGADMKVNMINDGPFTILLDDAGLGIQE